MKVIFFGNKKIILFLIVCFYFCLGFPLFAKNKVVLILNGASSSGKTSIAHELVSRLNNEVDHDEPRTFVLLSADFFDEERERVPKESEVTDVQEDGSDMLVTTQMNFLQEIKKQVLRDKNVVVDGIFTEKEQALLHEMLDEYAYVHIIAVYCSPRVLVEHVCRRNSLAVPCEQRSIYQAACDFSDLWSIHVNQQARTSDLVDEVTFEELSFIVNHVQQELLHEISSPENSPAFDPENQRFLEITVAALKKKFTSGFDTTPISSPIFMSPRGNPFLVVNSGRNTPAECAEKIIKKINDDLPPK